MPKDELIALRDIHRQQIEAPVQIITMAGDAALPGHILCCSRTAHIVGNVLNTELINKVVDQPGAAIPPITAFSSHTPVWI